MVNRYRRATRSAEELGLGPLSPLDQAIPELGTPTAAPAEPPKPLISNSEIKAIVESAFQAADWGTRGDESAEGGQDEDTQESPAPSATPLN